MDLKWGKFMLAYILFGSIGVVFTDLLILGAIISLGALLGWLFELIHVPSITGFFFSGILVGIVMLFTDSVEAFSDLKVIGSVALSFIAFELGTRLYMKKVSHNASEVLIIVLFQALFTIGLVAILLILFNAPWEMALVIGVIAMATSPETIMVLSRKYKSQGHLTDAIMPHIGMDDIVGVILFAIVLSIATAVNGNAALSLEVAILEPVAEIFGSILAGGLIGAILSLFIKLTKKKDPEFKQNFLTESVVAIILITALTSAHFTIGEFGFALSPILTPMFAGIFFTNLVPKAVRKENDEALDSFTPPFIFAFFSLIGIQLVISLIEMPTSIWILFLITGLYVILRVVGKQLGVFVGSKVKKTPKEVVKYLVWTMLPQATVSLGMAQIVLNQETLPEYWRKVIFIVVLMAAIIYNVIGPIISERALMAANEVDSERLNYFNGPKEEKTEKE
jgi:NhaP-type Na+/H+ or K+/H+ antiporter